MNMGGDQAQQTQQAVFVYRPTLADVQGSVRARARRTGAGRGETALFPLMTTCAVTVLGLLGGVPPAVLAAGAVLALGFGLVGGAWSRRGMARRLYGVVAPYGECRTVIDERGAATTGETMSYTADWTLFTDYVETPELFVMLGGPRAVSLATLPKRGAQEPDDIDRVRAILDRNLRRR